MLISDWRCLKDITGQISELNKIANTAFLRNKNVHINMQYAENLQYYHKNYAFYTDAASPSYWQETNNSVNAILKFPLRPTRMSQ
jgi:hypothetical protein